MNINCQNFSQWYPGYKSGQLSPLLDKLAREHLLTCNDCQKAANLVESAVNEKIRPEADPFFYTRFQSRLENRRDSRRVFVARPVFAYTFLLAVSIFFGIRLGTYFYQKNTMAAASETFENEYAINSTVSGLDVFFYDEYNENP
jgi:hypothetical protein